MPFDLSQRNKLGTGRHVAHLLYVLHVRITSHRACLLFVVAVSNPIRDGLAVSLTKQKERHIMSHQARSPLPILSRFPLTTLALVQRSTHFALLKPYPNNKKEAGGIRCCQTQRQWHSHSSSSFIPAPGIPLLKSPPPPFSFKSESKDEIGKGEKQSRTQPSFRSVLFLRVPPRRVKKSGIEFIVVALLLLSLS